MQRLRKILIITESYPPILNSAGRLFSELAESLYQEGFDVVVLTERPNRYTADEASAQGMDSHTAGTCFHVIRLPGFPKLRSVLVFRYIEQFLKMVLYFITGLFYGWGRKVIIYSPPLPLAVAGILISRIYRQRNIINVQDLYPETPIALGVMKSHGLIHLSRQMEKWIYKHADTITVHSEGNRDYVVKHGASSEKVHVVFNWVDLQKYSPGPQMNGFRSKYDIQDKFIVSYAGVIGLAQGVEELVSVARLLSSDAKIYFVLAGGGLGYNAIKKEAMKLGLKNILFLPHLVEKEYIGLLRASDVCLVTLVDKLKTPVVPGKLQSIMSVGRPVICSVPSESDAKRMVEEAHCGMWLKPGDTEGLIRAIDAMFNHASLTEMGLNGRQYAQRFFERTTCIQTYFELLEKE